MNWNVSPCAFCQKPLTWEEMRLGVFWTERVPLTDEQLEYMEWLDIQPVSHFAHKACWSKLKARKRRKIRKGCHKGCNPQFLQAQGPAK